MASGYYKAGQWYFIHDSKNEEDTSCTDGWRDPYSCFNDVTHYSFSTYTNPKLLIPMCLLAFNTKEN